MKNIILSLLCLIPAFAEQPQSIALFDGKSLAGWTVKGAEYWSVKNGSLVGKSDSKKQPSVLWSKDSYADFILEAEFQFSGDIDSGFFLREENEQIQIGVSRSLKRDMTCSPYIGKKGRYPVEAVNIPKILKPGEWNRVKIDVRGKKYIVHLNGQQVLDYTTDHALESGPVGLQIHAGVEMEIAFRNLRITSLAEKN